MKFKTHGVPVRTKGPNILERARSWWGGSKETPGTIIQGGSWSFATTAADMISRVIGRNSHTGRAVTQEFALQVSTVWRCVQLLSQTIGSLPWALYEKVGPGNAREVNDHPLADILIDSPNAEMDRMQFREAITANLSLRGNSYSLKETKRDGNVSSLYPIPTSQCLPRRNQQTGQIEYPVYDRGKLEVYPREKIWHIRQFGFDGLIGLEPLGYGRQAIALASAAEEFGAKYFGNGARASAIVEIPQWLDDDQRPKAKRNIDEFYSGLDNAHGLRLLEGGMKYTEISAKPNEAQHNELRGFQIPDICRFFGVPPHLAFDLSQGSYNNVETLAGEFVMFGLLPHLIRIETAAQKQLLLPGDRRRFFLRFNFEGLLRANSLERAQFYSAMLQNGVFSRNEVREKENLNRIDEAGMDDRTVQTNLALIQFIEAMAKAGAATGRGNDPTGVQA